METPRDWAVAVGVVALLFLGLAFYLDDVYRLMDWWKDRKDRDDE